MIIFSNIRAKISIFSAVLVLLALTIAFAIVINIASNLSRNTMLKSTKNAAHAVSLEVSLALENTLNAAQSNATAMLSFWKKGNRDRELIEELQRDSITAQSDLLGIWAIWEPNQFDGQDQKYVNDGLYDATGRMTSYWVRDGNKITRSEVVGYEGDGSEWYSEPRDTQSNVITEPYLYPVNGVDTLMSTFTAPIIYEGKSLGVGGADLSLTDLQTKIAEQNILPGGWVTLVTETGMIVTSKEEDSATKNIKDFNYDEMIIKAVESGKNYTGQHHYGPDQQEVIQVVESVFVDEAGLHWAVIVSLPTTIAFNSIDQMTHTVLIIGLLACIMSFIIAYIGSGQVSNPITQTSKIMRKLAAGETIATIPFQERSDEVGDMARALGHFQEANTEREQLRQERLKNQEAADLQKQQQIHQTASKFKETIQKSADQVNSDVEDVQLATQTLRQISTSADEASSLALDATSQTTDSIDSVANAASGLQQSIEEIASKVDEGAHIAQGAAAQAEEAQKTVDELGEAAKRIDQVLTLIRAVAEQTNLLALNATIEAARAGDAGKGFAVVAGEVKQLASQTAQATEQISNQIEAMQTAADRTKDAVIAIQQTNTQMNEITSGMAAAVTEQTAATTDIARNAQNAASSAKRMDENMETMASVVKESRETVEKLDDINARLNKSMTEMDTGFGSFLQSISS